MAEWRLLDTGPCNAFYNMAVDEAISISVRELKSPPTLRLYGWDMPSLSIGCFQKTDSIELEYCHSKGIPVVRRPTGGRAILHADELTYSFSALNKGIFKGGISGSYKIISDALLLALESVGVSAHSEENKAGRYSRNPLCFQSRSFGEVSSGNIKLIGSAQKRWPDGFLQQGSIPFSIDADRLCKIFKSTDMTIYPHALRELVPSIESSKLKLAVKNAFQQVFCVSFLEESLLFRAEEALVEELVRMRYGLRQWNLRM